MGATVVPLFGTGLALPLANLSVTAQLNFGNSASWTGEPTADGDIAQKHRRRPIWRSRARRLRRTSSSSFEQPSRPLWLQVLPAQLESLLHATVGGSVHWDLDDCVDNDYYGAQQTVALSGTGATGPHLRPSATSFQASAIKGINTTLASRSLSRLRTLATR